MNNLHGPATQHVAWAHHQRVTDFGRMGNGFCLGTRSPVRGLAQAEFLQQLLEALTVFSHVDGFGTGANNGNAVGFQCTGQFERRLSAILDDHAHRALQMHDFQHIFKRQRFEVKSVGCIVIGRDRFRIAVDHDGFIAIFTQGQRRMHTAIIKFDTLTDTVGTTAEHNDFLFIRRMRFALVFISGIHVRGFGSELCGAGIDALVDRTHAQLMPHLAHFRFGNIQQECQATIGKAVALEATHHALVQVGQRFLLKLQLNINNLLDLLKEPGVDFGERMHFLQGETLGERITNIPDALRTRLGQLDLQFFAIKRFLIQSVNTDFKSAQGFLK